MAGNSIGNLFKITTFGESHGKAIGVIVDGVPPRLKISEKDIQKELDRRKPGQSSITTQRKEYDKVEILSGIFEGQTTGTPLAMMLSNIDMRSQDYNYIKDKFRPGHADFTFLKKFGIRDWRGSGRASGRETAARVAAGAIAKKVLAQDNIKVIAYTVEVAGIRAEEIHLDEIEKNPVRCPHKESAKKMIDEIIKIKELGDSIGGIIQIVVKGVPPGLGEPVFDKLDADLAKSLISIGAIKGVEFGSGFASSVLKGSQNNDIITTKGFKTNHSGGILGGISTGQDIMINVAVKPPSSISIEQSTITTKNKPTTLVVKGRHDPCICPRVVPVCEAMVAITILDHLLLQKVIQ